ncbi:HNH endonuclease signature motif containing protein [Galactobacter valiniphilus]|uniref:HNH endonuclease signature motif containing protein n=1 Tax=Galactobacter valiniphilus TaxID=2676122 RepID=UPI0037354403
MEAIRNATTLLRFVTQVGPEAWDGAPEEDVVQGLQAVAEAARVMDALKVSAAGAVERRSDKYTRAESLCSRLGYGGTRGLIADVFGTGYYQAKAWLDLAADTHTSTGALSPRRPALAEALRLGELSIDTAKTIRDALDEVTSESIPGGTLAAEATLVANATAGRVNLFACQLGAGAVPASTGDTADEFWRLQRADGTADEAGESGAGAPGESGAPGGPSGALGAGSASADAEAGRCVAPGRGTGMDYWPVVPPRSSEELGQAAVLGAGGGEGGLGDPGAPESVGGWFQQAASAERSDGPAGETSGALFGGRPERNPGETTVSGAGSAAGSGLGVGGGVGAGGRGGWRGAPQRWGVFQGAGTPAAGGRPSLKNVRQQAKGWGDILEPRKTELNHAAQHRARSLSITPADGGGFKISGYAPEVEGQAILTVIDAYLSPRTTDPVEVGQPSPASGSDGVGDEGVGPAGALAGASEATGVTTNTGAVASLGAGAGAGVGAGGPKGSRSRAQKSFDALAQVFRSHAASEDVPQAAGGAPTLLITATLQALDAHLRECAEHEGGAGAAGSEGLAGGDGRGGRCNGNGNGNGNANGIGAGNGNVNGIGDGYGNGNGKDREAAGGARSASGCGGSQGHGWWPTSVADMPLDQNGIPDTEALIDLRFARIGQEGLPVPFSAVAHLLCDASIQMLLQDPGGVPLKLGRARRIFSKDQRRVLAARDRHCRAPGCEIPAKWCEVHHVTPWNQGGKTDVDNGILLCSFHHHEIDRGRLRVEAVHDQSGGFRERHRVRMPRVGSAQESLLSDIGLGAA